MRETDLSISHSIESYLNTYCSSLIRPKWSSYAMIVDTRITFDVVYAKLLTFQYFQIYKNI